jgi:lipopolysaccharide transport system permease protein
MSTIAATRASSAVQTNIQFLERSVADFLILVGGALVALQLRLQLSYGATLGADYDPLPPELAIILLAAALIVHLADRFISGYRPWPQLKGGRRFGRLIASLVVATLLLGLLLPALSKLQLLYGALSTAALGAVILLFPAYLFGTASPPRLSQLLLQLWAKRDLIGTWLVYNVRSRYSQTILGILWIILLPLSISLVLAFVFSQLLATQVANVPFVSFFLAALVPWGLFNYGIILGSRAILNMMGLINQVYFPREILVIVILGEGLVDLFFTFSAMIVINAFNNIWPNPLYIFLPFLLFIQICLTLGLMLFTSCLSVMVRDVPQLVSIIMQILFYLTPIIYPLEAVPARFRFLLLFNPLVPLIQAYRDIIVYNRMPDLLSLMISAVVSIAVLYAGYMFFKANERQLADLI